MDERLGDILYLLALAAFFIFSSIMKAKKAKKSTLPQPEPADDKEPYEYEQPEFPTNFDDFMDAFDDNVKEAPETKVKKPSTSQRIKTDYPEQSRIAKPKPALIIEEYEHSESSESFWDEEEFDLKKAIIFSEILKRPEL